MQQLSIFDLIPNPNPTPLRYPNPKKARQLRQVADNLTVTIEQKLHPAIAQQRPTRRRARIARGIIEEGQRLELIQSWLYAMADAAQEGTLPDILYSLTAKTQLQVLAMFLEDNWRDEDIKDHLTPDGWGSPLLRAKLTTLSRVKKAIAALEELHSPTPIDPIQQQLQQLEQDLIGTTIAGYFPTPKALCQQMVSLARLADGMRVLEPSAGKGDICEAIMTKAKVQLEVCEIQPSLRQILTIKGFNLIAINCFDVIQTYDRILMNPPFGKGKELEHIRHAYDCLKEGGRLVAIAPESIRFRKDKLYGNFRDWLETNCVYDEALPEGTFLQSDRPTGVRTRLLVLEK